MKIAKFKSKRLNNIEKFVLTLLVSIFLVYLSFIKISRYITSNIREYLIAKVKKENTLLLKDAFSVIKLSNVKVEDLLIVTKNSNEEIVSIDFKINECYKILSEITSYLNDSLTASNYVGYRLDIPLGVISNNPLVMNLGPKIPIKVELGNVALGNVRTTIKEFGINNVLMEVYIDINLDTSIFYPFDVASENTVYSSLISSKIVNGVVPNFYNGIINSKTEEINLPLNQ